MIRNKDSKFIASDLALNSVHAVITDPAYSLNLMNLNWDRVLPPLEIWEACYTVMRPGGFLLAFGHPRLYHRLGCQLEDAGFEIKDCLCWCYATGNPRPLNIDRAIDKDAGSKLDKMSDEFDREFVADTFGSLAPEAEKRLLQAKHSEVYQPVTDAAKIWQGWANNLKNSWEPIIMAQKPLEGKYIENVQKYNVGGLNIDECRIPFRDEKDKKTLESFKHFEGKDYGDDRYFSANSGGKKQCNIHPGGRWPANLIWLDPLFMEYDHIFMIPKPSRREKGDYNEHSTVKPVELMERLIRLVTPRPSVVGEKVVVLDPFAGSGTTGIAAKNLKRHFEGYETDPESFQTAFRRLKEKSSNYPDMFAV